MMMTSSSTRQHIYSEILRNTDGKAGYRHSRPLSNLAHSQNCHLDRSFHILFNLQVRLVKQRLLCRIIFRKVSTNFAGRRRWVNNPIYQRFAFARSDNDHRNIDAEPAFWQRHVDLFRIIVVDDHNRRGPSNVSVLQLFGKLAHAYT